jgi:replicative DNA helicase
MEKSLYNLKAEQGLLGCCMLGGMEEAVAAGVDGAWFYDLRHHEVYRTLESMYERAEDLDIVKIVYELRNKNVLDKVGGATSLTNWQDAAPTKYNAPYWLSELFVYKTRRQTKAKLENALTAVSGSTTGEVDDMISSLQTFILDMKDHVGRVKDETIKDTIVEVVEEIEERYNNKSDTPWGIPTGFLGLDNALGGLRDGGLYIIAGRPGQGKTAMAISIARNVLISGSPIGMFSLEMTKKELGMRLMAVHGELDMSTAYRGVLSKEDFRKISKSVEVKMLPLYVNDRTDLTVNMLRSEARRYVNNFGVRLIIVDYLQLLQGSKEARKQGKYEELSEISRGLKLMATEVNVPVIALAQLNREVEKGSVKRKPQLSDLRGSGSIEQDADCCMFIYDRPMSDDAMETFGKKEMNMVIAKNRNGDSGKDIGFEFQPEYTKFTPLSPVDR